MKLISNVDNLINVHNSQPLIKLRIGPRLKYPNFRIYFSKISSLTLAHKIKMMDLSVKINVTSFIHPMTHFLMLRECLSQPPKKCASEKLFYHR